MRELLALLFGEISSLPALRTKFWATERRSGSRESGLTDAAFGVAVPDLAVRTFPAVAVKVVAVALFEVLDLAGRERLFVERDELVRLYKPRGDSRREAVRRSVR